MSKYCMSTVGASIVNVHVPSPLSAAAGIPVGCQFQSGPVNSTDEAEVHTVTVMDSGSAAEGTSEQLPQLFQHTVGSAIVSENKLCPRATSTWRL
jgi:hypothetical protein